MSEVTDMDATASAVQVEMERAPRMPRMATKTIIAATIGETLEFYDFTAYSVFGVYVAHAFFPTKGQMLSLLLTVATFGIGFVTRPLGALLLGAYADRFGRKRVLSWTIWLMGLGTGAIAILPTYESIGIAAPLLLVLARLVQGFSAGGEVGAASLLIYEAAPGARRGFAMSWQLVSRSTALVTSGLVGYALISALSDEDIQAWGWRLTFAAGLLILPVGIYIRSRIDETLAPIHEPRSLRRILFQFAKRDQISPIIMSVLFIGGVALNQLLFLYMTTYALAMLKLPAMFAMLAPIVSGMSGALAGIFGGWTADRFGKVQVNVVPRVLMMIAAFPALYIVQGSGSGRVFLGVLGVLSVLHMLSTSIMNMVVAEAFPKHIRAVAVSTTYAVSLAIFGATAQVVATGLIAWTGNTLSIAWMFVLGSLLSIVTYIPLRRRARTVSAPREC